ncbi:hypothetical protein [Culex mononega-like virus 2]|uniref:Uncharacterized protein n=1 Tax=Culex mononega-like virus 2 TaxID=2010272 RepID=A0A1Z2RT77_9MONO|nr:hypothetical protein [Culex mononega-like virus 2]
MNTHLYIYIFDQFTHLFVYHLYNLSNSSRSISVCPFGYKLRQEDCIFVLRFTMSVAATFWLECFPGSGFFIKTPSTWYFQI